MYGCGPAYTQGKSSWVDACGKGNRGGITLEKLNRSPSWCLCLLWGQCCLHGRGCSIPFLHVISSYIPPADLGQTLGSPGQWEAPVKGLQPQNSHWNHRTSQVQHLMSCGGYGNTGASQINSEQSTTDKMKLRGTNAPNRDIDSKGNMSMATSHIPKQHLGALWGAKYRIFGVMHFLGDEIKRQN